MKNILLIAIATILLQINANANRYEQIVPVNSAGYVNQLVSAISNQLTQNKNYKDIQKSAIAITSFVSLDNMKATERLSYIISENLIHEMQVRGYKVIDFKVMNQIKVAKDGDFIFSRDVSKLRNTLNVDYALTGTYIQYKRGTVVNARIIDLKTHVVLSSAQILIPRNLLRHISSGYQIPDFTPNKISLSQ